MSWQSIPVSCPLMCRQQSRSGPPSRRSCTRCSRCATIAWQCQRESAQSTRRQQRLHRRRRGCFGPLHLRASIAYSTDRAAVLQRASGVDKRRWPLSDRFQTAGPRMAARQCRPCSHIGRCPGHLLADWMSATGRDRRFLAAPVSCRSPRSGRDLKLADGREDVRSSVLTSRWPALLPGRHRSTRTRGHDTCPSAAASMRRRRRASGSHEPPRATNLWVASMTGPPATSSAGLELSNLKSSRAICCVFRRSTSRRPSALMSRMEKVECTIRDGVPSTT